MKPILACCFWGAILLLSCTKKKDPAPLPTPPVDTTKVVIQPPVEPPLAPTIGFFLDGWQGKNFSVPSYTDTVVPYQGGTKITVNPSAILTKVPLSIFGNNANPYMGQMVGDGVLLGHIQALQPRVLRFPGGNLSSVYFWNGQPGVKPPNTPDSLLNAAGVAEKAGYWYGRNNESWTLSLDNYYAMLQQTGNTGMITINYAYARYGTGADPVADAAHLAADWVRYDKGRTRYWEIGNESNGEWQAGHRIDTRNNKDGQPAIITGALYGTHFKVFADSMRKAAREIGHTIYIGAQLLEKPADTWQNATDKGWNSGVLSGSGNTPDYYIVHSYYTPYNTNSTAAEVLATASTVTKSIMDYTKQVEQGAGVTVKPLAMTEWNIFATGSMQMVSHINGMHAVIVLGELLKNKYGMASRWDLANGWDGGNDHGTFNSGDEPGAVKWNPRPVFYHMYYFQKFLGDRAVQATVADNNPNVTAYASSFTSGQVGVTIVNKAAATQPAVVEFQNFRPGERYYWYLLAGGTDNGEFSRKVFVNGQGPSGVSGGPSNYTSLKAFATKTAGGIRINMPPRSVVYMVVEK